MPKNTELRQTTRRLITEAVHRAASLRRTVEQTRQQIEESRRLLDSSQAARAALFGMAPSPLAKKISDTDPDQAAAGGAGS